MIEVQLNFDLELHKSIYNCSFLH